MRRNLYYIVVLTVLGVASVVGFASRGGAEGARETPGGTHAVSQSR